MGMTLFDITKKNIKGNFKNYLIYFISMFMCVVIYYTFVSLQYSTEIADSIESSQNMQMIFMIASIVLILFVVVFILYSNNFFTRKRKKEIGLYSLLGLPKKTIGRMLFYENLFIGGIVLVTGIAIGTLFSKMFTMILIKLLGTELEIGMTFSLSALVHTLIVFLTIIFFTSIQGYRLIYKFKLIELFRSDQEGELEPKASIISAILAVIFLVVGYGFAFRNFSTSEEIMVNLIIMTIGVIVGTILLFDSLIIVLLKAIKKKTSYYYKGMNLISISNLVYRIKGNARTLSVITLLSATALCAFSVGFGMYHSFEQSAKQSSPFSYMFVSQSESFNKKIDTIIQEDKEHPIKAKLTLPVIKVAGEASSSKVLSDRDKQEDDKPIKIISVKDYNKAADVLGLNPVQEIDDKHAIAIRPMYTDYTFADVYQGNKLKVDLPKGEDKTFEFAGMTPNRVINWSYPDIMIIVNTKMYEKIKTQVPPIHYMGYMVQGQTTTKQTANTLAGVKTPESNLLTFYSEYRVGIEGAAFNVFILGFLGLVFVMATGSIIYFKQLTEATSDKFRYDILRKIGVSRQAINNGIVKQIAFIFIVPLVVALVHYLVILGLLKRLFSAMASSDLLPPILVCVIVFVTIYIIYYVLTVNSISKTVNKVSPPLIRRVSLAIVACIVAMAGIFLWFNPPTSNDDKTTITEKIKLELPKPTGKYLVGKVDMHLVDKKRVDPWVKNTSRELMISIWYPAQQKSKTKALYMEKKAAKYFDEKSISSIGVDSGLMDLSATATHAWKDAPVAMNTKKLPVVIYSPGGSIPRNFGTVLVEELASRGYIVVTVDHPYETSVVEFPDGRLATEKLPAVSAETILKMMDVRVKDIRFVLDQLESLHKGNNPDHEKRNLPAGLNKVLDLSRIGIFGHSAGGATSAQSMYEDRRLDAGIDMDGTMGHMPDHLLPVAQNGLKSPFMLMHVGYTKDGKVDSHLPNKDRNSFWKHSTGWKFDLAIPKGGHFSYTDYQVLLPQISQKLSVSSKVTEKSIGTVDSEKAIAAQKAYIPSFFDHHLRGISQPIFKSPSPYKEVHLIK
jgi:ABC-type antimicrobial peptide transport system permease subunit